MRNVSFNPSWKEIESFYPGDNYVDMLCCSLYGPGNIAGADRLAQFAKQHHKAFGIAECNGNFVIKGAHKDWNRYWKPVFNFVERNDVRLMVYLNNKEGLPNSDNFQIMSSSVLRGWKDEMQKPRYVLGGDGFYKSIGYDN